MFLAAVNRCRQMLHLSFVGVVTATDLQPGVEELRTLLADLKPGFVLLTDLSRVETMEVACENQIGSLMELCQERGVGRIIRVIPEPSKDIGFSILSIFHYQPGTNVTTCTSLADAARHLCG